MIDVKRICYVLLLAMVIGLGVVYLRTAHKQAVHRMVNLAEQEQEIRAVLWERQVLLSEQMESPVRLKQRIADLDIPVRQQGADPQYERVVATRE